MNDVATRARNGFVRAFGGKPAGCWAAPGRINILGEHTDYNNGFALPCAIGYYTVAAVAPSSSPTWRVWSEMTDTTVTIGPAGVTTTVEDADAIDGWAAYVAGGVWTLKHLAGDQIKGARIAIASDVPIGAGLSSSAALEIAVLTALRDLYQLDLPVEQQIRAAQSAERDYVGVPSGILDQTVSLLARTDHALLIDCDTEEVEQIPLRLREHDLTMMVIDTGVSHNHVEGEYIDRQNDCARAAQLLGVDSLRDVEEHDYIDLPDLVLRRRVRHVLTENRRTQMAAAALKQADDRTFTRLGRYMYESHLSMLMDFEISVQAVDHAVAAARRGGAVGARMTGGGFGGCVIALVPNERAEAVRQEVCRTAEAADLPEPDFYDGSPAAGAHKLDDPGTANRN